MESNRALSIKIAISQPVVFLRMSAVEVPKTDSPASPPKVNPSPELRLS
jgi:hypothetical protein